MGTAAFLKTLFDFLNKEANYAVLRNFEGLPEHNDSRDIDIIIEKKEYAKIKPAILSLVEHSGWKVLTYLNSDRLITWVCATLTGEGRAELVQLDFFLPHFRVWRASAGSKGFSCASRFQRFGVSC